MVKKQSVDVRRLTFLGILSAGVALLQMLGSFIHFGPFSVTLVLLPIVIGAAFYGPYAGAWLGFFFGVMVLVSGDAALFWAVNPFGTVVTVISKGILCGLAAGFVYRVAEQKGRTLSVIAAAAACPIVNTGVFLICSRIFFVDLLTQWAGGTNLLTYMIVGLVGGNFLFELGINMILSPVIVRVIRIFNK